MVVRHILKDGSVKKVLTGHVVKGKETLNTYNLIHNQEEKKGT